MNCTPLHRLAIALSTVAVVVSIAIDDGRAAKVRKNTVQAELPPGELVDHAVGDKAVWMHKKRGGKKFTVVVTGVKGGIVSWQRTDGCSYDVSRVIGRPPTKWKNCYGGTGTAKVARKGKSRLYPLKVGNTEKFSVQGKNRRAGKKTNTWSTTRTCKVKSTANVTVPAGRFDAYRIDCSDEWTLYRMYYSTELRLPVLYIQAPRKGKTGRHAYQELVSFEPAKASGGTAQGERKTSSAAVASKRRIKTEQEFHDVVAGRKMTNERGHAIPHEDGSLTGKFGKYRLTGSWSWEGEFFCRIAKHGTKKLGLDCQTVVVSGDSVTFTRKKGKGKKSIYQLN